MFHETECNLIFLGNGEIAYAVHLNEAGNLEKRLNVFYRLFLIIAKDNAGLSVRAAKAMPEANRRI